MSGNSPLQVMIGDIQRIVAAPRTTLVHLLSLPGSVA
jgi:hypothetical protein